MSGQANLPGLKRSIKKAETAAKRKEIESSASPAFGKRKRDDTDPHQNPPKSKRDERGLRQTMAHQSEEPVVDIDLANPSDPEDTDGHKALTFAQFERYMEREVKGHIVAIEADLSEKIGAVNDKVAANSFEIESLQRKFQSIQESGGPERNTLQKKFLFARRCLRIWPIRGKDEQELWQEVGNFIHGVLKVPASEIGEENIEEIRRTRKARSGALIQDEVIVVFADSDLRDSVSGYARNLAECRDKNNKPTAGIRIEVPVHLRGAFKLLESHGRLLRERYGEELKRHIKFDDYEESFYLSVKLPDEESWRRISPAFAHRQLEAIENDSETKQRLAGLPTVSGRPPIPLRQNGSQWSDTSSGNSQRTDSWPFQSSSSSSASSGYGNGSHPRRPRWGASKK